MNLHYSSRKYEQLVKWIAYNDNPGDHQPVEEVAGYLTVTMLAHCYNLAALKVAQDVMQFRNAEEKR